MVLAGGSRGADPAGGRRRARQHGRPVEAQRRPGARPRGRSTATATGSSSARAAGVVVVESLGARAAARGDPDRRGPRRRADRGRVPHLARPSRPAAARPGRCRWPASSAGVDGRRGRLDRRPRDVHAAQRRRPRRGRSRRRSGRPRYRLAVSSPEVDDRPPRRRGRDRVARSRRSAAIRDQVISPTANLRQPGPAGVRPRLRAARGAEGEGRHGHGQRLRLRRPERGRDLPALRGVSRAPGRAARGRSDRDRRGASGATPNGVTRLARRCASRPDVRWPHGPHPTSALAPARPRGRRLRRRALAGDRRRLPLGHHGAGGPGAPGRPRRLDRSSPCRSSRSGSSRSPTRRPDRDALRRHPGRDHRLRSSAPTSSPSCPSSPASGCGSSTGRSGPARCPGRAPGRPAAAAGLLASQLFSPLGFGRRAGRMAAIAAAIAATPILLVGVPLLA